MRGREAQVLAVVALGLVGLGQPDEDDDRVAAAGERARLVEQRGVGRLVVAPVAGRVRPVAERGAGIVEPVRRSRPSCPSPGSAARPRTRRRRRCRRPARAAAGRPRSSAAPSRRRPRGGRARGAPRRRRRGPPRARPAVRSTSASSRSAARSSAASASRPAATARASSRIALLAEAGHLEVEPGRERRDAVVDRAPVGHDDAVEAPLAAQDVREQLAVLAAQRRR